MSYSIVYKRLLKETHFINSYNDSGSDKSFSNKYIINYKLITLKDGYSFKLKFYDS